MIKSKLTFLIMINSVMNVREELVKIWPIALGIARKRTRNPEMAEDVVMEAFAKILAANTTFEDEKHLRLYMGRTVKNVIIDNYRKDKLYSHTEVPDVADPFPGGSTYELQQIFEKLSKDCQEILELFGLGHSYKKIAKKLEIPIGTVMSRMARCRKNFTILYNG